MPDSPSTSPGIPQPKEQRLRLLVVDDNPINLTISAKLLQKLGQEPDLVSSAQQAIEVLQSKDYDLIFMDCHMPRMDGFEATRAIRAAEKTGERTPIVALTARAMEGDRKLCMEAGMDDYLAKPVSMADFARVLERWT